jgi:predicted phosphate transport protein (TIGR00153 family)
MARFSLVPRDEKFFEEFIDLAGQIRKGSTLLGQMLAGAVPDMNKVQEIKDVEHECDRITHAIIEHLNRTFVTPLDREDIHALASRLDDVIDAIDAAASVMRLYKVTVVRNGARRLAEIIADSTNHIADGFAGLEKRRGVLEAAARVSQLEHEADRVHQDAIVELFDQEANPINVIKWKEILDFLEAATDRCEDVGNLLEGIVVKHG